MLYHIVDNAAEAQALQDAYLERGTRTRKVRLADCWLVLSARNA